MMQRSIRIYLFIYLFETFIIYYRKVINQNVMQSSAPYKIEQREALYN